MIVSVTLSIVFPFAFFPNQQFVVVQLSAWPPEIEVLEKLGFLDKKLD